MSSRLSDNVDNRSGQRRVSACSSDIADTRAGPYERHCRHGSCGCGLQLSDNADSVSGGGFDGFDDIRALVVFLSRALGEEVMDGRVDAPGGDGDEWVAGGFWTEPSDSDEAGHSAVEDGSVFWSAEGAVGADNVADGDAVEMVGEDMACDPLGVSCLDGGEHEGVSAQ